MMPSHFTAFEMTEKKSIQAKNHVMNALFYKTFHVQKRQRFTNICCILLCPALLVSICGIIQISLQSQLGTSNIEPYNRYFCVRGKNDSNNFGCKQNILPIFANETGFNPQDLQDTVYQPKAWVVPFGGYYFGALESNGTNPNITVGNSFEYMSNLSAYAYIGEEKELWGSRESLDIVNSTGYSRTDSPVRPTFGNGLLKLMPNFFKCTTSLCQTATVIQPMESPNAIKAKMLSIVTEGKEIVNLRRGDFNYPSHADFALVIEKSNAANRKLKATVQQGDFQLAYYGFKESADAFSLATVYNMLANVMYKQISPNGFLSGSFREMPTFEYVSGIIDFSGVILMIFIPLCFSFLLPVFVHNLVKEKEERIFILLKINGVDSIRYFGMLFMQYFVTYLGSAIVFLVFSAIFSLRYILKTNFGVLAILFILWGSAQVSLAFLISSFFNRAKSATIFTAILTLGNVVLGFLVVFTELIPNAFMVYSPYAFFKALILIVAATIDYKKMPYGFKQLTLPNDVGYALLSLFLCSIIYFVLSLYILSVKKTEFGTRKNIFYPFIELAEYIQKKQGVTKKKNNVVYNKFTNQDVEGGSIEDKDVQDMRAKVDTKDYKDVALVVKHLRKNFGPKLAVKDATFYVERNTVFGLLGSNGAGKSSLISCLSGLLEPTYGSATYFKQNEEFDLIDDIDAVHTLIGLVPQHDVFIPDLSVQEHVAMFAMLKGADKKTALAQCKDMLELAKLGGFEKRFPNKLSGGEKRRVSISMASVGQPSVVFLDEPTTGLDAEVRRNIWSIIEALKVNSTVILTTHNLEEAEQLCHNIGIFVHGEFKCMGTLQRLKSLYGSGYHLSLSIDKTKIDSVKLVLAEIFEGVKYSFIDNFENLMNLEIEYKNGCLTKWFRALETARKSGCGIIDFGLSQTSLEDVFLKLVSESEASASS